MAPRFRGKANGGRGSSETLPSRRWGQPRVGPSELSAKARLTPRPSIQDSEFSEQVLKFLHNKEGEKNEKAPRRPARYGSSAQPLGKRVRERQRVEPAV